MGVLEPDGVRGALLSGGEPCGEVTLEAPAAVAEEGAVTLEVPEAVAEEVAVVERDGGPQALVEVESWPVEGQGSRGPGPSR